jgi:hypothetical protein
MLTISMPSPIAAYCNNPEIVAREQADITARPLMGEVG